MDKNSAAQQIYELREAAERQRQQLSQSLQVRGALAHCPAGTHVCWSLSVRRACCVRLKHPCHCLC